MRPLSIAQARLLACSTGYTVRGRVRVEGPGGTWYNLSSLFDRDFLEEATVDESLDSPVTQATVRVRREVHGLSLAPLVSASRANNLGGSYSPLLDPGRLFRVEVGLAPSDREPGASDWLPLFLGRIDTVDSGPDVLSFSGRDLAGVLQDTYLVTEQVYGSTAGTPLQTVCQALLQDAQLGASFPLYTPVDPAQALGKYKQDLEPVMDAVAKLATARGWEVRWKLRPDTGDWGLWLWGPNRAGTTLAWTYDATAYRELGELSTSLEDVRTAVEVVYSDTSDLDVAGQPKRKTVLREDATARARYGFLNAGGQRVHRFCRIAEGASSSINTQAEAERLADSALLDLSTASVGAAVEVQLHPGLELGDMVQLAANGLLFSAAQTLAVRQVTHTLSSGGGRTKLALRGKPALSERVWLDLEARGGIARPAPFTGPAAPAVLSVTPAFRGFALAVAPSATGPVTAEYELHVSTVPGFTPDTSNPSSTLRATSSTTLFTLNDLAPATAYRGRVVSRDAAGNRGPASTEFSVTTNAVQAGDFREGISLAASLLLNPDFEDHPDTGLPPAAWKMLSGTWGTNATVDTFAYTGARSLKLLQGGVVVSQPVSVRPGTRYSLDVAVYINSPLGNALVQIDWLNANLVQIDNTNPPVWPAANNWGYVRALEYVPTGARYARVRLFRNNGSYSTWVDSVVLAQVDGVEETPRGPSGVYAYQNGWTSETNDGHEGATYYRDSTGRIHIEGHIRSGTPGLPAFTLPPTSAASLGYRAIAVRDFVVATSGGPAIVTVYATGEVTPQPGVFVSWWCLNGISFRAK